MKYLPILFLLLCSCASTPGSQYAGQSTAELKLRHTQCVQFLGQEKKDWSVQVGNPLLMDDGGRAERIEEKENIEKELLRRYQAGDKEAYLPAFGGSNPN